MPRTPTPHAWSNSVSASLQVARNLVRKAADREMPETRSQAASREEQIPAPCPHCSNRSVRRSVDRLPGAHLSATARLMCRYVPVQRRPDDQSRSCARADDLRDALLEIQPLTTADSSP